MNAEAVDVMPAVPDVPSKAPVATVAGPAPAAEGRLTPAERAFLARHVIRRHVPAGTFLWHEGEPADTVVLVASGVMETMKETEFAGRRLVLGLHKSGSVLGIAGVMEGRPRMESVRAVEACEVLVLPKEDLDSLLREAPVLAAKLLRGLLRLVSARLRQSVERLAAFF